MVKVQEREIYFSGKLVMFACCTCGMSEDRSSRMSMVAAVVS